MPTKDVEAQAPGAEFPPLDAVTTPAVTTSQAAHYLNRKPQTLRTWACNEEGPVRPLRIHGRLAWPTADLRRALGMEAVHG